MGIPFTAPWGSGTLVVWTPLDTPSLDLITRARFRRWTNASVTTRPAGSIFVGCAGLRGSPASIAGRWGSPMGDGGRDDRHSPGWRPASASQLLPRRIHLPLQSPQIKGPRAALPSPRPASTRRWTRALQRHRQASGFQRLPDNGAMKGIPILVQNSEMWLRQIKV